MIQSMSYDKLNREYHRLLKLVKQAREIMIIGNKQSTHDSFEAAWKYCDMVDKFLEDTKEFENV